MINAVVFDFGGVMTTCATPTRVREIVEANGLPWQAVLDGFNNHRRAYDIGDITVREFYERTWRDAGVAVDEAVQAEIERADTASFLYANGKTHAWMKELKARGYKIGILTNMPPGFAPLFRKHFADFIALAETTVISGEVHCVKPMREIYDMVRERLGVAADEICFFDDAPANCRGAEEAGWRAIRFENVEQAAAAFEERTK